MTPVKKLRAIVPTFALLVLLVVVTYRRADEAMYGSTEQPATAGLPAAEVLPRESISDMCCCEATYYESRGFLENWLRLETTHEWKEVGRCQTEEFKTWALWKSDRKWVQICSQNVFCGR